MKRITFLNPTEEEELTEPLDVLSDLGYDVIVENKVVPDVLLETDYLLINQKYLRNTDRLSGLLDGWNSASSRIDDFMYMCSIGEVPYDKTIDPPDNVVVVLEYVDDDFILDASEVIYATGTNLNKRLTLCESSRFVGRLSDVIKHFIIKKEGLL